MSYFTKEQEAKAVELILKECNFCPRYKDGDSNKSGGANNSQTSMAYVERDENGYVVAMVDLGLHKAVTPKIGEKNNKNNVDRIILAATDTLRLGSTSHWRLPPSIGYLTHLKKLTVYHCKGLPREIVHLAGSLEEIAFHFCDELDFENGFPWLEFQSLHKLTDFRIHGRTSSSSREAKRILPIPGLRGLPNLRYLYYRGPNFGSGDEEHSLWKDKNENQLSRSLLVQDLLHPGVRFKNSLEILEIERGNLTEVDAAGLVTDVLPHYPKLQRLVLPNNRIASLELILAKQSLPIPPSVRLRCLNLLGNPVLNSKKCKDIRPERKNLLRLLSLHEEITSLGHGITESAPCTTKVLLALDRNDGGAVLLSKRFRSVSLSVWPIVLERANHRIGYHDCSNVLYHFLRNGPVLGLQKRQNNRSSAAQNDLKGDDFVGMIPPPSPMKGDTRVMPVLRTPLYSIATSIVTPTDTETTSTRKRKISMP